jgi:hypothetical protein
MTKDIIIKVIDYKPITDNYNNYLVLEFNGSYINNIILNTLRRVIMELIPIYAFDKTDITITKNTSIYNNDYMKLRISQFPIFNVENDISNIDKCMDLEYESNLTVFDQQIENIEKQKELEIIENVKKAQNFIINIDIKNTTNNSNSDSDISSLEKNTSKKPKISKDDNNKNNKNEKQKLDKKSIYEKLLSEQKENSIQKKDHKKNNNEEENYSTQNQVK